MKNILLLVLALCASQANATIIKADFSATVDNPSLPFAAGAREARADNQAVGAGLELGAGAAVTNPSGWQNGDVFFDLDPTAYTLTLQSQDFGDFETFAASISNIVFDRGERITGLRLLSNDLVEDGWTADLIAPLFSFTDNSIAISYSADEFFYFTGGSAVFQIETEVDANPLPEPASAGLLALGLAGVLAARRRARR